VRNCVIDSVDIDMIGGGVQIGHPRFARLGNGIEFWIGLDMSMNDNLVQNCTISRTYDCGATIQGMANYDKVGAPPTNNRFINNRFYHCRQAFEHFIPHVTEFVNCEFSGNICYEMGQNEFSSPELRDANILSYEAKNRLIKISDNIFFNANHYCGRTWSVNMSGNTVYIKKGQYLNNFFGKYAPIIFGQLNAVEEYRARLGDNTTKFIEITDANTAELMGTTFAWVKELEKKMGKTNNK